MENQNQIYKSMAKIIKEVGSIGKNKTADMKSAGVYKFRGIDDMYNSLHDIFAENEVFIIPKVLETKFEIQDKGKDNYGNSKYQYSTILTMEFTFFSSDGSSITATGVGHALDSGDKGTNKAQSSALKYCLMQTFLIPTEDDKDVENSNLTVDKKVNTNQNNQSKPPQKPPVKPVDPPKTEAKAPNLTEIETAKVLKIGNNLMTQLENNQVKNLEEYKKWVLDNEKILGSEFATKLLAKILENQSKIVNIETNPDNIPDQELADFESIPEVETA